VCFMLRKWAEDMENLEVLCAGGFSAVVNALN